MIEEVKPTLLKMEEIEGLELGKALNCEMDADGTKYSLIIIPFKGHIGCGFITQSNAYLVIDGGEKTAYSFKRNSHWSYVWEKLIRGYRQGLGETDARNTTYLIARAIEKIEGK